MPKAGVLSVTPYSINEEMNLKKLYLMFDKLLIDVDSLEIAKLVKDSIPADQIPLLLGSILPEQLPTYGELLNIQGDNNYGENFRNITYLNEIGFVEFRDFSELTHPNGEKISVRYSGLIEDIEAGFNNKLILPEKEFIEYIPDAKARIMSLVFDSTEQCRHVPLLRHTPQKGRLANYTQVFRLLLQQLPQPDDAVSWEQLLDFKNDPNTMASYYAFGDWMNEISKKDYSLHEIEDKFKYLYHQYDQQYRIHKVKTSRGFLELFITGTLDALSGKLAKGLGTGLFSIFRKELNLLEEETKFPGREVAYIHKAKQAW